MKQFQVTRAYHALCRLSEVALSPTKAYAIYSMMKKLQSSVDFQADQEKKIFEKYECKTDDNGIITFANNVDKRRFAAEMIELGSVDIDIDIIPIEIGLNEMGDRAIQPCDIGALEGFVSFVEA